MGRQINYYMNKNIENEFMKYVFSKDFKIISEESVSGKTIVYNTIDEVDQSEYYLYLYKTEFGDIINYTSGNYRIDNRISPVIEFIRTYIKDKDKEIIRGRIWFESKYYGEDSEIIYKNPMLIKEYESLVRWIKKNVPYQEVEDRGYVFKEYISNDIKKMVSEGFKLM